jgi:hypothetical protein
MARSRKFGEDFAYNEWHFVHLPELYPRIGHRLDQADRDWTEYCHFCKTPLLICETVRDVGQNLYDKATTVTRQLAQRAHMRAALVAYHVPRSSSLQREITELNERLIELTIRTPIDRFQVRQVSPRATPFIGLTPNDWAGEIALVHREHHAHCQRARELPVHRDRFLAELRRHPLHVPALFDALTFDHACNLVPSRDGQ